MRKFFAVLIIFLLTVPLVFAEDIIGDEPTVKIIYQGSTPIKNAIDAKSKSSDSILKEETDKIMKDQKYPYSLVSGKTEIKIIKYTCDQKMGICGYWIQATRDGREVYTNSPIWISPPPYEVVVSKSLDSKNNELTVTIKEDPKGAVEQVLQGYVDRQPLGTAVSYER
jgi:hypothetical protein